MFETLLATLLAGIQVWDHERREEFARKTLALKREWYEEYSKPVYKRSDDKLARIELELRRLANAWATTVRTQALKDIKG